MSAGLEFAQTRAEIMTPEKPATVQIGLSTIVPVIMGLTVEISPITNNRPWRRWRLGTVYGYEVKGIYLYRCRCRDIYIREGKRFMALLADDTTRLYKKLAGFRKWEDDSV